MDSKESKKPKLSTQPYKGARDFYPEDMAIRNYIFNTWRKVCRRYGYEEYDNPIIENFEVFASKTGEEIVNNQLYSFEDKGGRKIAIRPELTPSTVRMIATRYQLLPQPIRWFMIGNNWRFEKPQLGRGREFYQLEMNIFGIPEVIADWEIFQVIIAIMNEFGANEAMFTLKYSDRKLVTALLKDTLGLDTEKQVKVRNLMDKWNKMKEADFIEALEQLGLPTDSAQRVLRFMSTTIATMRNVIPLNTLEGNEGYKDIQELQKFLSESGLEKYCKFDPSIIRGFDYSDGLVYEVFDKNQNNPRSLFGGERFDGLIKIFGDYDLPATGFGMGDYTLLEFLKNWNLLPKLPSETKVYVTLFDKFSSGKMNEVAKTLREKGINTAVALKAEKLDKQLKYSDRKGIPYAIIAGPDEIKNDKVILKDLKKREQKTLTLEEAIAVLK